MEPRRRSSSSNDKSSLSRDRTATPSMRSYIDPDAIKPKTSRDRHRNSYIPVLRGEKIDTASYMKFQQGKSSSASKISRLDPDVRSQDYDERYKQLQEKEKTIAEYYTKIDEMVQNFNAKNEEDQRRVGSTESWSSCVPEMVCDNDILLDVETNVHQISDIWFTTTTNFSSILKNVHNDPCGTKAELEDVKLKLAIKQAKSLSLMKSKCVIEDVRKLLQCREAIRTELENLIALSMKCGTCGSINSVRDSYVGSPKMGTGDSYKECSDDPGTTSGDSFMDDVKEIHARSKAQKAGKRVSLSPPDKARVKEKEKKEKRSGKKHEQTIYNLEIVTPSPGEMSEELKSVQSWTDELNKKNETISNLNCKIFRMQQTISEQSLMNNELQVKLSEYDEKVQWNQVLWKQIGKMKEQIKGLQLSNRQLECQKKELLCRMTRLDQEIERLIKMNDLLNKKKFLLNPNQDMQQLDSSSKRSSVSWERNPNEEKALVEKRSAIDQLQTILNIMTDQKNLAQQQINMYQSKIEELESMLKNNKPC